LRAVVDTNVVAYHLLGTEPFRQEAGAFWRRVETALAPSSWEAELVNLVWLAIKNGIFDAGEGMGRLELARRLDIASVPVRRLWSGALARAASRDHPASHALFVELAPREGLPLVSFDQRLLDRFPDIACRPRDLEAG
jgi:predicted nucleic acid-binding protein